MRLSMGRRLYVAMAVAAIAGWIFYVSYFQENAEAYLFPSIVATVMLVFSLISLIREVFDLCVDDYQAFPFLRQLPVIGMMVAAVLLVEILGMYSTAFVTLCAVSIWYSPVQSHRTRLIRSVLFAAGFAAFMYLLFTLMLNVQLPRGLWI